MYSMSKFELLAASQACMIYLIMFMIDHTTEDEINGLEPVQDAVAASSQLLFLDFSS